MNKLGIIAFILVLLFICTPLGFFGVHSVHAVTNTVTVYSGVHSGYIYATDVDYETAHNAAIGAVRESTNTTSTLGTGQFYAGGDINEYFIYRSFLFFDTSVIPAGATIDNASLQIYLNVVIGLPNVTVAGQALGIASPHDPLVPADYACPTSGLGGYADAVVAGVWLNITLNSTGLGWIISNGETRFVLRTSEDVADTWVGNNYLSYATITAGVTYAPKLVVSYTGSSTYTYIFHGPYVESGNVYNGIVNASLSFTNQAPTVFFLNGSSGTAETYTVTSALPAASVFWNITADYGHSRQYVFRSGLFDEVWLYVPAPIDVVASYSVSVTDFAGLSNVTVETDKNIGGYNRIIERAHLDVFSGESFWLVMYTQYTLKVVSDQGTFSWGLSADGVATKNFVVTKDMVPTSYNNMNSTVSATRVSGSTANIYFYDANGTTSWINTTIYLMNTSGLFSVASQLDLGSLQNYTVTGLSSTANYLAYIVALQNGFQQAWTFTLPAMAITANPWSGLFASFSTDIRIQTLLENSIAIFVVLMFFAVGSWKDTEWFLGVAAVIAGFFIYIGWLNIPVAGVSAALLVIVFMYIHKGKQESREF
jgi:hypothetical protein